MKRFIDKRFFLYPVSLLYGTGVWLRNKLFDWNFYKERSFKLPIICIGNLTVGGTGKTPHTEYLIRLLQNQFQVAVLSRGYKRKSKGFQLASPQSTVNQLGDEPFQMKQKYPNIHMAVDANRCHGIEQICKNPISADTDVILLDDAYQHRYVKAGLNILLIDYNRPINEDQLLPCGQLREHETGKYRAHIVIVTKCPKTLTPMDFRVMTKQLNLFAFQQLYFSTLQYGKLYPLFTAGKEYPLNSIHPDIHILLVTGIASPQKLEEDLSEYNQNIHSISFGDHHKFTANDMLLIQNNFDKLPEHKRMLITTEKDAVRLKAESSMLSASIKPYIYVLPIEVAFLQDQQDLFNNNIIDYVRKNPRNSILP